MTIDQYKDLLLEDELKIGVGVPEDEFTDDGELETYAFASEPFSREPGEYTLVPAP